MMLRKCRPRQGTSSPGAACRGRARPTREGKQHKGTRRTRVAGLVKDLFADTPKTHCTRLYCASVTACLNCCAIPPVLEVRRLALVSRWSSARPWSVRHQVPSSARKAKTLTWRVPSCVIVPSPQMFAPSSCHTVLCACSTQRRCPSATCARCRP